MSRENIALSLLESQKNNSIINSEEASNDLTASETTWLLSANATTTSVQTPLENPEVNTIYQAILKSATPIGSSAYYTKLLANLLFTKTLLAGFAFITNLYWWGLGDSGSKYMPAVKIPYLDIDIAKWNNSAVPISCLLVNFLIAIVTLFGVYNNLTSDIKNYRLLKHLRDRNEITVTPALRSILKKYAFALALGTIFGISNSLVENSATYNIDRIDNDPTLKQWLGYAVILSGVIQNIYPGIRLAEIISSRIGRENNLQQLHAKTRDALELANPLQRKEVLEKICTGDISFTQLQSQLNRYNTILFEKKHSLAVKIPAHLVAQFFNFVSLLSPTLTAAAQLGKIWPALNWGKYPLAVFFALPNFVMYPIFTYDMVDAFLQPALPKATLAELYQNDLIPLRTLVLFRLIQLTSVMLKLGFIVPSYFSMASILGQNHSTNFSEFLEKTLPQKLGEMGLPKAYIPMKVTDYACIAGLSSQWEPGRDTFFKIEQTLSDRVLFTADQQQKLDALEETQKCYRLLAM